MNLVNENWLSLVFRNVLLGGYFHGRKHLTYGVDVRTIRWLGVLQVFRKSSKFHAIMDDESGSSYYFLSLGVISLFLKMDLVISRGYRLDICWLQCRKSGLLTT